MHKVFKEARLLAMRYQVNQTKKVMLLLLLTSFFVTPLQAEETLKNINVSFTVNNVTVRQTLNEIEKQSRFRFFYESSQLNVKRKVSLDFNGNVEDALNTLFSGEVMYRISGKHIILQKKQRTSADTYDDAHIQDLLLDNLPESISEPPYNTYSIRVIGKIIDESSQPLPGVNIIEKGTTNGTTTDQDGNYSLNILNENSILVFSFIGYASQEITVGNKTEINISLTPDFKSLEEVVVVGYGTAKKKDLTGSQSSIGGELFKERRETQVSQALQGSISGVTVTRNGSNGAMGTGTIRIRGITTIGTSDPLVIVDGVPFGDVNQVNPSDIETLTVLKDAAASSIYGSRAAAGVILITTKRAKTDQVSVQYGYETGFDTPTQLPENMGAIRYMELQNEMRWNDAGNGANQYPAFSKVLIDGYEANSIANPDLFPDTDWVKLTLSKTASRQSHSVNIIGGSKSVKSSASVRYEKVGGFYDNKNYERIFARSNNDFTINKYVGGMFDFNFRRTVNTDPNVFNPLEIIRNAVPIYAAEWADGRVADGKAGDNIYGRLKYGGTDKTQYNQLGGRMALDIKPIEGLKISTVLAPIFNFNSGKKFNKQVDAYSATDPSQFVVTLTDNGGNNTTKLTESRQSDYSLTTQVIANYEKNFANHYLTFLAGYENFFYKNESLTASRDQYLFDSYPYLDQGPLTLRDNSGTAFETAYRSAFGRITYSYQDKYLLQANVRYDGSSRFNSAYRWGTFPSVSAGWVMSEENFLKNQNVVSFLKIRASWGALGNERIGNYPYFGIINFNSALFYQNNVAVAQQTAAQVQYAIDDITWEKTESTDIGVDVHFLNDRLRFTGDVYFKETKDMLLPLQIPIYVGFANPNQNTGTMTTKGIDLDLSWTDKWGDLKYSASANVSQFESVMGNLGGTQFIGNQIITEGSGFNEWYGYKAEGIYQTLDEVNASPKLNANIKPGDLKYTDISGPNGEPDGRISPEYDRVLLGNSLPQWTYGGNIRLGYKGFDLGISAQGVGYQNSSSLGYTTYNDQNFGRFPNLLDGNVWSAFNTAEQNLTARYPRYTETNKGSNRTLSDFWLFNGGYFRLKNVTLGYTVPQSVIEKIKATNLRVYVSGSDLFSISKYPKGFDPEGLGIVSTLIGGVSITF